MNITGQGAGFALSLEFREGQFVGSAQEELDRFFEGLGQDGNKGRPLVIHFHGGLVPLEAARAGASRLGQAYQDAGAVPLFVLWNSGLGDSLATNLKRIVGEPFFKQLVRLVSRRAVAKDRQEDNDAGVGRGSGLDLPPESDVSNELAKADLGVEPYLDDTSRAESLLSKAEQAKFEADVKSDRALAQAVAETQAMPGGSLVNEGLLEDEDEAAGAGRGVFTAAAAVAAAGRVLYAVVERRVKRTDHGFYPTVIEEIARKFYLNKIFEWSWGAMKADAADAFAGSNGGAMVVEGLRKLRESGDNRRVVLVGHSAGSIWICHWLRHAAEVLKDPRFEVVLLAPACTFEEFGAALAATEARLAIRVFAMDDRRESADHVGGLAFPRSLLYLVSGLLEDKVDMPILGMQRYHSGLTPYTTPAVTKVAEFLRKEPGRLVWSVTKADAPAGLRGSSTTHGGFNDDKDTLESLQHILKAGLD